MWRITPLYAKIESHSAMIGEMTKEEERAIERPRKNFIDKVIVWAKVESQLKFEDRAYSRLLKTYLRGLTVKLKKRKTVFLV